MSHQPERQEKNCLNCGATVHGRYCHICGQENVLPHQHFWSLSKHFVYDIFHFDGKFFDTLKYLLLRPGWLSKEYVQGRRIKYLDPIRMYLFTSAIFFIIFFAASNQKLVSLSSQGDVLLSRAERFEIASKIHSDSTTGASHKLHLLLDTNYIIKGVPVNQEEAVAGTFLKAEIKGREYALQPVYDSTTQTITEATASTWLGRLIHSKSDKLREEYNDDIKEAITATIEKFLHKLPYLLYLSLPFFALILKLLYIRRKNFFYSDHAVFTLHHYIFTFLILLLVLAFDALGLWLHWRIFGILMPWVFVAWAVYLYIEMKNFYGQGWRKTLGKFLLLNILALIVLFILFVIFLLISTLQL